MQKENFVKAGILTLLLTFTLVLSYELWLRYHGYTVSYDDDERLWAKERAKVYQPAGDAVVFIGSSRIKFDLDIPTWKNETGVNAVQLSMVGSCPRPLLHNLAEDKNFKGRLIIDVTETLFFNDSRQSFSRPTKGIKFYASSTPSEKVSTGISEFLESDLVLLDQNYFSLNGYLRQLQLKNRTGVMSTELPPFPWEFGLTQANRQTKMHDRFVEDTNLQVRVRNIWTMAGRALKAVPPTGSKLDSVFAAVKADIDKIKSRGGEILFVRTPSSGASLQIETKNYPREKYWDRLLVTTGCAGVNFRDYESISHFTCPEQSHLTPADAQIFTKSLVQILEEKGWKFQKSNKL
jgi:hypothetical protein